MTICFLIDILVIFKMIFFVPVKIIRIRMLSFLKWTPFLVNFPRDKAFLLGKKAKLDIHHLLNNEHTIHQSTFFFNKSVRIA